MTDNNGWSPLHAACAMGHDEIVRFLLDHGVSVEMASTRDFRTPLTLAASFGRCEVVRLLHGAGADLGRSGGGPESACLFQVAKIRRM